MYASAVSASVPALSPLKASTLGLLALLVTGLVHGAALQHGFVHDDRVLLADSPVLGDLSALPTALGRDLFWLAGDAVRPSPYWRPVVVLTYFFDRALGGGAAWAFHLGNLLLLAALGVVAARPWRRRGAQLLALGLVCCHPFAVEVAVNITARTDLLAALFGTLALGVPGLAGAGLTLLALGSKEVAVVVPLLAVVHARSRGLGRRFWLPHVLATGGWLVVRTALVNSWPLSPADAAGPDLSSIGGAAARVFFYLGRIAWPVDPVPARSLPTLLLDGGGLVLVVVSWVLLAALVGLIALLAERGRRGDAERHQPSEAPPGPPLATGLALLLFPLLPVSGLLASRVRYAEGFLCWSLVGLAWLLPQARRARLPGLLLLLPLMLVSRQQVDAWADEATLWETAWARRAEDPVVALRVAKDRAGRGASGVEAPLALALDGLRDPRELREAHALAAKVALEEGREATALVHLRAAVLPGDPESAWAVSAGCTLGVASPAEATAAGIAEAQLLSWCEEARRQRPGDGDLANALGVLHARAGRLDPARDAFAQAVEAEPSREEFQANLARVRAILEGQTAGAAPGAP